MMKFRAVLSVLPMLCGGLLAQSVNGYAHASAFPRQITHVVVIFQENRTPDNLFHFLTPACPIPGVANGLNACTPNPVNSSCYNIAPCGLSNQLGSVAAIPLAGIPMKGSGDPTHSHTAFSLMCDPDPANGYTCRNDGAWKIKLSGSSKGENSYSYVLNPAIKNDQKL